MESRRLAPTLGIVASLSVVGLLLVPYAVVDGTAVGNYYGSGLLSPWVGGLLALVAVVVFAAGREERTEPETAAGIGVGLGLAAFVVAAVWAVTVPAEVPLQLTTDEPLVGPLTTGTVLEYHRWVLAATAALVPAAGAWYAKTLRLF
ncbi:DUF7548 family protein [Natronomonas marina]|jgi:hypothetical protein|uniref:DUF7548 family protein n=1 Tax=Natronomonas marina TaxID=2961939 RepID=UPI0020C9BD31|nr:hypothetical protein [Natronomonas marina]